MDTQSPTETKPQQETEHAYVHTLLHTHTLTLQELMRCGTVIQNHAPPLTIQ